MVDTETDQRALPTGTVTFLRTDIEGSMRLARRLGAAWDAVNASHMGLIRGAVEDHGGTCVRTEGDAVFAVFPEARKAVSAAIAVQRALAAHEWPDGAEVRVRIGLHSGEAYLSGDDYGGFEVNRAARIAAAGHGGQIVLSDPTRALIADALPEGVAIRDLGRHALRDVPHPERLFQLDVPGLRSGFPALRTVTATVGDLPSRLTSFIGREEELEELDELLTERRLVTLTGPGGIGKTSLAIEAARRVAARFADGAWFVPLADVEHAGQVRSVIARTIGLFDGPGRPAADGLGPYLAERSVLLVLDNFERLLDASGDVVDLLDASSASRILVTSRAPLRVVGEQEYPVPSLGEDCPKLFAERARSVRPGWDAGADSPVLDEVCTLLDRLPLGVELAAARVAHLPLAAIRDRLRAQLPLPGSGPRNVPDRQRTLAGAIAWSHDLLGPELQRLLHDLAVFDGGFDLEQAAEVVEPSADGADVLDHLATLVDQSLITRDGGGSGIRFDMLGTIRAFALERLRAEGREDDVRRRHAVAYLALAETAAPHMPGPDQPRWLDRLTIDYPNLRSALRWSIDAGEARLALRFVAAMWRFWQQDGRLVEGTELAESALAMPGADAPTQARLAALSAAGGIAYWHGRREDSFRHYREELDLARRLGDVAYEADATWNLSFERYIAEDGAGTTELLETARRLYERIGDERGVARVDWSRVTVLGGDHHSIGLATLEALSERFERLGDPWYTFQNYMSIAWGHFMNGDIPTASHWYMRAVVGSNSLRDVTGTTIAIPVAALLAVEAGRPEDAAMLLGASDHLTELYGVKAPLGLRELLGVADPSGRALEALGEEPYRRAFDAGRQMTLGQVVERIVRIQEETWGAGHKTAESNSPN